MITLLLMCVSLNICEAVIYRLTASEYELMPPMVYMDSYELCQEDADALYCMSEYVLVSDEPSPLLNMIQEFSEHHVSHYNHSRLRYGTCVKQTCRKFYDTFNGDLRLTLEACLNESISIKYDLKVKILEKIHCKQPGTVAKDVDQLDVIVGIFCIILIVVNIIGSILEYFRTRRENKVLRFLSCFSLLRNWKKFMAADAEVFDPRQASLKSLDGIRVISIILVICVHSVFTHMTAENAQFIEEIYWSKLLIICLNASLHMQTFLIVSSFLLTYNWLLRLEKERISWSMLPKRIILRWLRLTPAYAVVLALTTTWFAHIAAGPLWSEFVEVEMNECRQYWWQYVLYIQNYFQKSGCKVESWYLAVDMQLYCLAMIIFVSCRTSRSWKIAVSLLIVAGIIIPAAYVYFEDLDAIIVLRPEETWNFFVNDPYFEKIYIPRSTVGLVTGYFGYHWQKYRVVVKKIQKRIYRILYWSVCFLILWLLYIPGIFYSDAPRQPLYVRVIYAAFLKPMFGFCVGTLILGCVLKVEDLFRGVLEWNGWRRPSRLAYSAYLLHMPLIRNILAMQTSTKRLDTIVIFKMCFFLLVLTFITTLVFWLLVEAPFSNIVKEYLDPKPERKKKTNLKYDEIEKFLN